MHSDRPNSHRPASCGYVHAIFSAEAAGVEMHALAQARLIAGVGIDGDRYATGNGHSSQLGHPDRQLTLIEQEVTDYVGRLNVPCRYLERLIDKKVFEPLLGRSGLNCQILCGALCARATPSKCFLPARSTHDGRGGSPLFHHDLAVGDLVFVSYPQPGMRIDPAAAKHVFIAGGIGVTAILGLLDGTDAASDREVHYCVRGRARAAYLDDLKATGARVVLHESARSGRLDVAALVRGLPADATIYYCGPTSLMAAVHQATIDRDPQDVRSEAFSGIATAEGERLGNAFDAWLTLSQRVIHVDEKEPLLKAMLREGIRVDYSCEGGTCGTCVVEVVDGEINHCDLCLSDEERQQLMTACVSRGRYLTHSAATSSPSPNGPKPRR